MHVLSINILRGWLKLSNFFYKIVRQCKKNLLLFSKNNSEDKGGTMKHTFIVLIILMLAAGLTYAQKEKKETKTTVPPKSVVEMTPNELAELGKRNKVEAEKFLKENATKKDVKTTKSGLQYKILREGTGPQPKATDVVIVIYRGTLMDGTEIDNSLKKRVPTATIKLDNAMKGWGEGIQLMKLGAKYQFFIPPELAYGKSIIANYIGPNTLLIYEIELMQIGE